MTKEVYFEVYGNDPSLLGESLWCAGSKSDLHPEGKGSTVGLRVRYVTRDANKSIVEGMSSGLKGCVNFSEGLCKQDGGFCPVAGVVSIEDYRKRISELKKLQLTDYATR